MNVEDLKPLVEQRTAYKARLSELAREEKEIREAIAPLEISIRDFVEATGIESLTHGGYRIALKTDAVPTLKDKEVAFNYIADNKMWELLPSQIGVKAYRELLQTGQSLPGVETYEKRSLSITKKP
jgi:hypothetical protein